MFDVKKYQCIYYKSLNFSSISLTNRTLTNRTTMDHPLAPSSASPQAIGVLSRIVAVGGAQDARDNHYDPILDHSRQTNEHHKYEISHVLALDAEERTRSRLKFTATDGTVFKLDLPRGTVLGHERGQWCVQVVAKPESVVTVRATDGLTYLRAAYHLGNRHVPLEITRDYLRFSPDSVLEDMVKQMGLTITQEIVPFQPERGAYHTSGAQGSQLDQHSHSHAHHHSHNHQHHDHDGLG